MSKQKLSIDLDPALIDRVRRYSEENGKEVAETVSEMIRKLPLDEGRGNGDHPAITRALYGVAAPADAEPWEAALTPEVRSILGAGAGPADEEDYYEYLMEKYGR